MLNTIILACIALSVFVIPLMALRAIIHDKKTNK